MSGINGDWYEALKEEFKKPYYKKVTHFGNLQSVICSIGMGDE